MKTLEWFRKMSSQSKWATRRGRCVVDCALKPTTWRAAGFSTTDACRSVCCPLTPASGWQPMVSHSTVHLDSNSIDDDDVSVRNRFSFFTALGARLRHCTMTTIYSHRLHYKVLSIQQQQHLLDYGSQEAELVHVSRCQLIARTALIYC